MNKNKSLNQELMILVLTGKITLDSFMDLATPENIVEPHPVTGDTVAHYLSSSNNVAFAAEALKYCYQELGLDLDLQDSEGETFLFKAFETSNYELVEFLLAEGADVNIRNKTGESALFKVLYTFDADMTDLFLRHGCDVDIKDDYGKTILEYCEDDHLEEAYEEIISLLIQYRVENSSDEKIKAYSESKIKKALKSNTDEESVVIPFLLDMLDQGEYRKLKGITHEKFEEIENLKVRFPHFGDVIDYIKEQVSLSLLTEDPYFSMKPILLYGGAGVGKTRFNKELSEIIGTDMVVIDGGTVTGGFIIGGGSPMWKGSGAGKVAKQIVTGRFANPIIQLDEIDKMQSQEGFDPYGPLHPLLEYNTAAQFVDEFIGVPVDCSYINWVATANDLNSIPDPILSRFLVVKIPDPSEKQMGEIAKSVYKDIIEDPYNPWGDRFARELSEEIINSLSRKNPREIHRDLLSAMGKVALKNKDKPSDLELSLTLKDVNGKRIGKKRKIGLV